jgi:hypothetical protein
MHLALGYLTGDGYEFPRIGPFEGDLPWSTQFVIKGSFRATSIGIGRFLKANPTPTRFVTAPTASKPVILTVAVHFCGSSEPVSKPTTSRNLGDSKVESQCNPHSMRGSKLAAPTRSARRAVPTARVRGKRSRRNLCSDKRKQDCSAVSHSPGPRESKRRWVKNAPREAGNPELANW